MISTFQRNRHFRKVLVNKTFTHVQEQKNTMSPRHSAYIPPLNYQDMKWMTNLEKKLDNVFIVFEFHGKARVTLFKYLQNILSLAVCLSLISRSRRLQRESVSLCTVAIKIFAISKSYMLMDSANRL